MLKYYISFLVISFFGFIFPMIMVKGEITSVLLLYYIVVLYASIRLAWLIKGNKLKILEMTYFIFVYVFLGIVPLVQIHKERFAWKGHYEELDYLKASLTIILGLISYEVGLFLGNRRKVGTTSKKVNLKFLIILGIISFTFAAFSLGGIENLFLPRNQLTVALGGMDGTSSMIYISLLRVPIFIALVYTLLVWKNRKADVVLTLLVGMLFILNLIASNPISTSRYWVGTVFLSLVFFAIKWKRLTFTWITIFILTLLMIVFPYADIFRDKAEITLDLSDLTTTLTANGDFDAYQQLLNTHRYTELYGFSYGEQLLGTLFFWIPREFWPDKPIGTGATIARGLGYDFTNVSSPLWAEFYINFGYVGVVLMFILYGALSAKLQRGYITTLGDINFYQVFVPVFSVYQIFLLRGDLLSSSAYLAPVIVFTLMGFKRTKERRHVLQ